MAIVRNKQGVQVRTYAGLQPHQYRDTLNAAGLLAPLRRARGLQKSELMRHTRALIRDLQTGRINTNTKLHALQLGLYVYPNETGEFK